MNLSYRDAVFHGVLVAFAFYLAAAGRSNDSLVYYNVDWPPTYGNPGITGFAYPPPFALLIQPFQALPWPVFRLGTAALELGGLVYLVGVPLAVLLIPIAPISSGLSQGNLSLFTAAVILFALRHSALWAWPLLVKVTPGVGVLWPLFRGQWRNFGIAVGTTALIAAITFVLAPAAWLDWFATVPTFTAHDASLGLPLWLRGPMAVGVLWYAARHDKPWLIGISLALVAHLNGGGWKMALVALRLWRDPDAAG